jgi:hypothetical protein
MRKIALICINLAARLHHSLKGVSSAVIGLFYHGLDQASPGSNSDHGWGRGFLFSRLQQIYFTLMK